MRAASSPVRAAAHTCALRLAEQMTFERRCALALVPLWRALGQPEPENWTIERDDKTWTKQQVEALQRKVDRMTDAAREAFHEKWSNENEGQWFGRYPILPFSIGARTGSGISARHTRVHWHEAQSHICTSSGVRPAAALHRRRQAIHVLM